MACLGVTTPAWLTASWSVPAAADSSGRGRRGEAEGPPAYPYLPFARAAAGRGLRRAAAWSTFAAGAGGRGGVCGSLGLTTAVLVVEPKDAEKALRARTAPACATKGTDAARKAQSTLAAARRAVPVGITATATPPAKRLAPRGG